MIRTVSNVYRDSSHLNRALKVNKRFFATSDEALASQSRNLQANTVNPLLNLSDKFKPWTPLMRVAGGVLTLLGSIYAITSEIKATNKEFRDEIKADNATLKSELKADNASLKSELKADNASLRLELKADNASLRSELKEENASLKSELKQEIRDLNLSLTQRIDRVYDELKAEAKILNKKLEKQDEKFLAFRDQILGVSHLSPSARKINENDAREKEIGSDRSKSTILSIEDLIGENSAKTLMNMIQKEQNLQK